MKKILLSVACLLASIIVSAQDTVIMDPYYEEGWDIICDRVEASTYLKDNSGYNYSPFMSYDGKMETAWCVPDGGIGQWIKYNVSEDHKKHPQFQGIDVLELNTMVIVNGLAASKEMYYANNRIKKLKVEFDNGSSQVIDLKDGVIGYQRFSFNVKSRWIKLTILEVYKGGKYNDTCISEINFFTSQSKWKKK